MLGALERAKIVITNYHAFKLRERMELSNGGRSLLQGRGDALNTVETEGQMIQRVMPGLMGIKDILEAISKIVVLTFRHGMTRRINRRAMVFDRAVIL